MAFDISLDYTFADGSFFTDSVRDVLNQATSIWEGFIADDFPSVPAGTAFSIADPESDDRLDVTLSDPIDDLRIFLGQESDLGGSTLAHSAVTGKDAKGDAFNVRISPDFRGQGPVTDFEPYAGSLTFDTGVSWNLDSVNDGEDQHDLLSVALHEIGHVLGIGQAPIYRDLATDNGFAGPNSEQLNGGAPLPLEPGDDAHVRDGFANDSVLMDPTLKADTRKLPSDYDLAMLADIGYQTDGFVAQGSTPAITTDGPDDPVYGTILGDSLDGQGGDDRIQGEAGPDSLSGGLGEDTLLGQEGADYLAGGSGSDQIQGGIGKDELRGGPGADDLFGGAGTDAFAVSPGTGHDEITDFAVGSETIVVHPDLGYSDPSAILNDISKPYANVSRIDLGPSATLDVVHGSQSGTPLTADDFRIGVLASEPEPSNGVPTPAGDTASTAFEEAVVIDVLQNDSDPDGDSLSIQGLSQVQHGTASVTTGEEIRFVPAGGFSGQVGFDYTVADGRGGTAVGQVSVTVAEDATPPTITGGSDLAHTENGGGGTVVGQVDAEDEGRGVASYAITGGDAAEWVAIDDQGDLTLTDLGIGSALNDYEAGANEFAVKVTATDEVGNTSAPATVSLSVTDRDDEPPVPSPDTASTVSGQAVTIDVLANDSDPDSATLHLDGVGDPANGQASLDNGAIRYTPEATFTGEASFAYTVADGAGQSATGQVTVTVGDGTAPTVAADQALSLAENAQAGAVLGTITASDPNGSVTSFAVTGGAASDWVAIDDQGQLTLTDSGTGSALNGFESGANEFAVKVTATDEAGNTSDAQTVSLTTINVDDQAPTVDAGQSLTLDENADAGTVLGSVEATDNDGGTGVASYAITGGDAAEWVAIDDQGQLTLTDSGTGSALNDYEAGANEFAVDVTATDAAGNTSDAQSVTLTTANVDDQVPSLPADQTLTLEEGTAAGAFLGSVSASDNEGGSGVASYAIASGPAADWVAVDDQGQLTLTEAGAGSALNDYETGANEFAVDVTASDNAGNTSDVQSVTLTTTNVDDQAPTLPADQSLTLDENAAAGAVLGSVSASDNDGGTGVASYTIAAGAAADWVAIDDQGQLTLTESGTDSPLNDAADGANEFVVDVTATDDAGNTSDAQAVSLGVTEGAAPTVQADTAETTAGEPVAIDVLANDSHPEGATLNLADVGDPDHGSASITDGAVNYVPESDYTGTDSFSYTVADEAGETATGDVSVTVAPGAEGLQVRSGFFDAGSTFGEAIVGPADADYFKVFDTDAGGFLTGTGGTGGGDNWLPASSLDQMALESGEYFVQAWGGGSGLSDWTRFSAEMGSEDSYVGHGPATLPADQEVSLDQLVEAAGLADGAYAKVYTAQQDYGYMKPEALADHTWTTPEDGQTRPVWLKTWLSGEGESGWSSLDVTGDDAVTLVGTADAGPAGIEEGT